MAVGSVQQGFCLKRLFCSERAEVFGVDIVRMSGRVQGNREYPSDIDSLI